MSQPRYLCIHGHFYQPPRENAWLEEIEIQESAAPFHDWNDRITAECYGPNGAARVLDEDHRIIDIVNNYAKMSFNFGPTLLSWMEKHNPYYYSKIIEADRLSQEYFGGHGSAMAQVYNHIIMPLANRRDKETQIIWGLQDFEKRFGRKAEGMWLAETAVDLETLELLVNHGVQYTLLAPSQAMRSKARHEAHWHPGVDPRRPYRCQLPNGKSITLFFYDGPISQSVAFNGLLKDGKQFANALMQGFDDKNHHPQLVHIATDGESYGHHHRHGEMALAYCIRHIEENQLARLTNYSQYLELCPPEWEVEIFEYSSWSCAHGVERWRNNCGCNTGGRPNWTQEWRAPLRQALDWLRDQLIPIYEEEIAAFTDNPWVLRNDYLEVIQDRSHESVECFFKTRFKKAPRKNQRTHVIRLLEMQRQALLMYTSCGWFFDEVSGIETTQILQYANRAIQLAERESDRKLEADFVAQLRNAPSNLPELQNGAVIYEKHVQPARLRLFNVGMHFAVTSLFSEEPENIDILSYNAESDYFERLEAGLQRMTIGSTTIYSQITLSEKRFRFAAIYLGQHHIIGSASGKISDHDFQEMAVKLRKAFNSAHLSEVIQIMQEYFPGPNFSMREMFKDEQIKVLDKILEKNVQQAENSYRKIFDRNYNLMNVMRESNLQIPPILQRNLEMVVQKELSHFFSAQSLNNRRLRQLAREVRHWQVNVDIDTMAVSVAQHLVNWLDRLPEDKAPLKLLQKLNAQLELIREMEIDFNPERVQNRVFRLSQQLLPKWEMELFSEESQSKSEEFLALASSLNLKLEWPKATDQALPKRKVG